jgi:hypothetical protein
MDGLTFITGVSNVFFDVKSYSARVCRSFENGLREPNVIFSVFREPHVIDLIQCLLPSNARAKKEEVKLGIMEEVKGVIARIDKLIRSKKRKLGSFSRFCLSLEAKNMNFFIPFYIFKFGEKKFDL